LLLVEDNEMNQDLAIELLYEAGIEVVLAENGKEALSILEHDQAFDGILMDVQMPVMDGYTAARELRKNPALAQMPIIAMTANAMAGDREKVIECGMNDHIAKPLDVKHMFHTIAQWIKPSRLSSHSHVAASRPEQPKINFRKACLPGINANAGLATMMGNEMLYARQLLKFRNSQKEFQRLFREAQSSPDPAAPIRLAHTLKGLAGNIGALELQSEAAKLEKACKEMSTQDIEAALAATVAELAKVIRGLEQLEDAYTPTASSALIDKAKTAALLSQLESLLINNDGLCTEIAGQISAMLKGSALAEIFEPAAKAIASYDFDVAVDLVHAAEAQLSNLQDNEQLEK
jgi:CheY-like chemotaxis protein